MEDHVNNLDAHKEKVSKLVSVLDSLMNDNEDIANQWKKVESEQALEAFQTLANEGIVEFECVCKDNE
jgi:hypothetical protein